MTFSSTRGMLNATALTRCRTAAYLLTKVICGIMGTLWVRNGRENWNWTPQFMRDYISVTRECSWWILIRDSLCPPDVIRLRTAGREWNKARLYGDFAALWFFLMMNKGAATQLPEWPSLRFDYRDNFGFASRAIESGERPDLNTFGCAGKWTWSGTEGAHSEMHPLSHNYRMYVLESGPWRAQLGTVSTWLIVRLS